MAFSVNANNKDTIERVHLLSNITKYDVQRFFEVLAFILTTNYLEGEWTSIPFVGYVKVVVSEEDGTVDLAFRPERKFANSIHQVIDGEVSEIEETFMNRVQSLLNQHFS